MQASSVHDALIHALRYKIKAIGRCCRRDAPAPDQAYHHLHIPEAGTELSGRLMR